MMYILKLLGPVHLTQSRDKVDGEDGAGPAPRFRSRRTVALLGYLAAERRPHAREHLAALFWPDEAPTKGRSNLRRELYNLARVLPDCWQADSQAVTFVPSAETSIDIDTLASLESEMRWQEAADMLAGEFLEGLYLDDNLVYENWLLAEREGWRERSRAILHNACEELARHGNRRMALPYARRLLQLTRWDEAAHRRIMRLLAWTGQREEAMRQYTLCRQVLADELGVEPSAETGALYRQIQADELAQPPTLPAFLAAEAGNRQEPGSLFVMRERELRWLDRQLDSALKGQGGVAFLTGSPGRGKTALIDAFAAQTLAAHPDLLVARGNCTAYAGVGDPYLPFRDIMAMLCGDVEGRWAAGAISTDHARRLWTALPFVVQALLENGPRLLDIFVPGSALLARAKSAEPGGAAWVARLGDQIQRQPGAAASVEQSTLFEQFSNVLRAAAVQRPLLLLIDDMQWMDAASTGLLFHLVRRITDGRSRILILCAYRPEEIMRDQSGARHLLAKVLSEFRRMFGAVWLNLSWADAREGRQFIGAVVDSQPNNLGGAFRAALFQRTAGHPLFTLELLRAMRERGDLVKDAHDIWQQGPQLDWQLMPARVEAVIEARIQQLEPEQQELLSVASVEGEQFTVQILAQVQNLDEGPLLRLLAQELGNRHRLVQEQEAYQIGNRSIARFGFRHALFQEYLYGHLSQAERRLLHGAVAGAMEHVYAEELETMSGQLARHYDWAGNDGRALHYFILAAEHDARVYAYQEAIAHYSRALVLVRQVASSDDTLASLHLRRDLAHGTTGQFDLARPDLESARELSRAAKEQRMEWRVLIELGKLWSSRNYDQARDYLEQALNLAKQINDPAILGRTLNRLGNWHANDENPAKAISFHQEALRIFEDTNDRPNFAITLDLLGIAHLLGGNYAAGVVYYNRAVELFRELSDYPRLVSSLIPRGLGATGPLLLALAPVQSPRDPFDDLAEAVEIARQIGSSPDEAWSAWALAMLYALRGDFEQALEAGRHGLEIASNIQHREWLAGNRFALGIVYNELLQPEQALQELEPGLALARDLQSQYWVNHLTGVLAQSYILLGDLEAARHCLDAVLSDATSMDTAGKRYCWARRAELALAMGNPALAVDIADRLIDSAEGRRPGDVLTFLWLVKGEALARIGRASTDSASLESVEGEISKVLEEARGLLMDGRDHAKKMQERFLLWRLHTTLGRLYEATGHDSEGEEELAAARSLIEEMAFTVADEGLADNFRRQAFGMLSIAG